MGENISIQWCTHTWNPHRGCDAVSPACDNCYAWACAKRNPGVLGKFGSLKEGGTRIVGAESYWRSPIKWNDAARKTNERPRVFCESFGDVFEDWRGPLLSTKGERMLVCEEHGDWGTEAHEGYPTRPLHLDDVRARIFGTVAATPLLDYLILTKRISRAKAYFKSRERMFDAAFEYRNLRYGYDSDVSLGDGLSHWPPRNVWMGTTVEDRKHGLPRIDVLREIPAPVRFLSIEPLLEDLGTLDLTGIHWVIVGGESGSNARLFNLDWARSIRDQCKSAGTAFFMKQLGSSPMFSIHDGYGRWKDEIKDSHGGDESEWPEDLQGCRAFPKVEVGA